MKLIINDLCNEFYFIFFNFVTPIHYLNQVKLNGAPFARTKSTIRRLQMYRTGKAERDSKGRITKPAIYQGWLPSGESMNLFCYQKNGCLLVSRGILIILLPDKSWNIFQVLKVALPLTRSGLVTLAL